MDEEAGGIPTARRKRPWFAARLSLAAPGLGHFYLGENGFGIFFALFTYFMFAVSFPIVLLAMPALWPTALWLAAIWAAVLVLAAVEAYRLALRYNAYGGPTARFAKHVDFVDSANAPIARTTLRLR